MAQHATIHGKTVGDWNGQPGYWIPVQADTNGIISVANKALQPGADISQGRTYGGMATSYYLLSATGLPTGWTGPGRLVSIRCLTNGTLTGLYDASSATGTNLAPALALTANTVHSFGGAGEAVQFNISPWFVVASGTYIVTGIVG